MWLSFRLGDFYEKRCRLSVSIMIAHMLDKYFVLFIFIPGEDNGIRKSDNLISRSVSNQDTIEFMSCFILFHLQLHRLIITAGQIAQVLKIMAVKSVDNILFVSHATNELFGLVTLEGTTSFLSYFQSIDYAAMAAIGGGSALAGKPFICSGANLMFSKSCYLSVFDDIKLEFASGDDVFLLHAFKQKGYRISFCKSSEALVRTSVEPTFSDLVKQRVRWGAKAKGYTDWFSIFVSLVVFLLCVAMIGSLALLSTHYYVPILLFLIKMVADGLFLSGILPLFQIRFRWFLVVIIQLFYPFWIIFIAAQGFWGTTRWKGRR